MAGGMDRRPGAQVAAGLRRLLVEHTPPSRRHCWVIDAPDVPDWQPALLVEWRRRPGGAWTGRVIVVLDDQGSAPRVLDVWVAAEHLHPAGRAP